MVLNSTKMIRDDNENNLDLFRISLESFRSFRGPLLDKSVTGQELFFAVSYSKSALAARRRVHDDGDSNLLVVRTIRPFSDQSKTMFLSSPLDLQLATYLVLLLYALGGYHASSSSSSSYNITTNMMTLHSTLSML